MSKQIGTDVWFCATIYVQAETDEEAQAIVAERYAGSLDNPETMEIAARDIRLSEDGDVMSPAVTLYGLADQSKLVAGEAAPPTPARVYVLTAEHFSVPGLITQVHASRESATKRAAELVNTMLADNGDEETATSSNWEEAIAKLQDEHGAAHCYVEIIERDVFGHVPDPIAAAAPAMLFALQQAEYWLAAEAESPEPGATKPEEILRVIRAAIAEAEGPANA